MHGDRGDVILGWFTKIALVFVLFGLVIFDGVSVGVAKVNIQDTANDAATEAADMYAQTHDAREAYKAAASYASLHDATVLPKSFAVARDGTVTLRVEKDATTLLIYRTKTTKKWAHVAASGSGRSV